MRRRNVLRTAAALVALAAPRIARPDSTKILRFVPTSDLVVLDPVFTGAITGPDCTCVFACAGNRQRC